MHNGTPDRAFQVVYIEKEWKAGRMEERFRVRRRFGVCGRAIISGILILDPGAKLPFAWNSPVFFFFLVVESWGLTGRLGSGDSRQGVVLSAV